MTIAEVKTMLSSIQGFTDKVAYHSFPEGSAPALPFICFLETNTKNFGADSSVYYEIHHIQIELYSKLRDIVSEDLISQKLTDKNIYYNKAFTYLDDEKCFMTIYEIEV